MIGDGIAQQIAHHAPVGLLTILCLAQGIVNGLVSSLAVVIVGVDHSEGSAVDLLGSAEHGVAGAPGLGTPDFGNGHALRQHLGLLLISVTDLHGTFFQAPAYHFHKILTDGFFNNDNGRFKTGFVGIVQGVVQDGFALAAHRIDLLQSTVAAAHTGGHNNKNRFFRHGNVLLVSFRIIIR